MFFFLVYLPSSGAVFYHLRLCACVLFVLFEINAEAISRFSYTSPILIKIYLIVSEQVKRL